jgi:hypothetical protein
MLGKYKSLYMIDRQGILRHFSLLMSHISNHSVSFEQRVQALLELLAMLDTYRDVFLAHPPFVQITPRKMRELYQDVSRYEEDHREYIEMVKSELTRIERLYSSYI